jgi:hypothetical protein
MNRILWAFAVTTVCLWALVAFAQSVGNPQVGTAIVQRRYVETLPTDGATISWTLSRVPTSNAYVDVYFNGLLQWEGVCYTLSGNQLTLIVATPPCVPRVPAAQDLLGVKYVTQY